MTSRFCERCERITRDGNLWCQDKECPAEEGNPVFEYGDFLGDLKITKLITVWRTAALYEALRGETPVFVKVAHDSPECADRLKREALAMKKLGDVSKAPGLFQRIPRPVRLQLLPPYPTKSEQPFGVLTVQGETRFFSVFAPIKGKLLTEVLLENPQLWHYEAAWIANTVSEALRPLAAQNLAHLSLTPNMIMVELDQDQHWRATLLDLGWVADSAKSPAPAQWGLHEPAYSAPEAITAVGSQTTGSITPAADVYMLGLILYEMLTGKAGYEQHLYRDEKVRRSVVLNRTPLVVQRPELEQAGVVELVENAIQTDVKKRPANLTAFTQAVEKIYGRAPAEKRPFSRQTYVVAASLVAVFVVAFGIAGYFVLASLLKA